MKIQYRDYRDGGYLRSKSRGFTELVLILGGGVVGDGFEVVDEVGLVEVAEIYS